MSSVEYLKRAQSVKYHTIEFLVFGKILTTGSEIFTFKPSKSYDSVTINLSKKSTFYLTSPGVNCTAFDSEQIWKRVWVAQKSLPSHAFKCFGLRTVEFSHSYSEFFRSLTIETKLNSNIPRSKWYFIYLKLRIMPRLFCSNWELIIWKENTEVFIWSIKVN